MAKAGERATDWWESPRRFLRMDKSPRKKPHKERADRSKAKAAHTTLPPPSPLHGRRHTEPDSTLLKCQLRPGPAEREGTQESSNDTLCSGDWLKKLKREMDYPPTSKNKITAALKVMGAAKPC